MTKRLEQALHKLYTSFYDGTLNPECCYACAVGNICDNRDMWKHFTEAHGSLKLNYVGQVNEGFNKRINGYLPSELLEIEAVFLKGCGFELPIRRGAIKPENPRSQDTLYNGMRAVISFLCELDNVEDVMEISTRFTDQMFASRSALDEMLCL